MFIKKFISDTRPETMLLYSGPPEPSAFPPNTEIIAYCAIQADNNANVYPSWEHLTLSRCGSYWQFYRGIQAVLPSEILYFGILPEFAHEHHYTVGLAADVGQENPILWPAHVTVNQPGLAKAAAVQLAQEEAFSPAESDDFTVVFIYPGHLLDLHT